METKIWVLEVARGASHSYKQSCNENESVLGLEQRNIKLDKVVKKADNAENSY